MASCKRPAAYQICISKVDFSGLVSSFFSQIPTLRIKYDILLQESKIYVKDKITSKSGMKKKSSEFKDF